MRYKFDHWVALVAAVCLGACYPGCAQQSTDYVAPLSKARTSNWLEISPDPISFGELSVGEPATAKLLIRNLRSEAVTVQEVETSCPCIRVFGLPAIIQPGKPVELTVRFDPATEPDFRGELSVELVGRASHQRDAFRTHANLVVRGKT